LESDILRPPEWIEEFLDLIARLRAFPHLATVVIRTLDLHFAERLGSTREMRKIQRGWQSDIDTVKHLAETIERFLITV
jgi:predicted RNase H-like nuclease